jgi:hypothetical protein
MKKKPTSLDPYEKVYCGARWLGQTLFKAKEKSFNILYTESKNNSLVIKQTEQGWFGDEKETKRNIADILENFSKLKLFDLNSTDSGKKKK